MSDPGRPAVPYWETPEYARAVEFGREVCDRLRDLDAVTTDPGFVPFYRADREGLASTLRAIADEINAFGATMPDGMAAERAGRGPAKAGESGWVAVEEQLPEIGLQVLLYCQDVEADLRGIHSGRWDGISFDDAEDCRTIDHVTHWRLMPEPPGSPIK